MKTLKTNPILKVALELLTLFAIMATLTYGIFIYLCFNQQIFSSETYYDTSLGKNNLLYTHFQQIHSFSGKIDQKKNELLMIQESISTFEALYSETEDFNDELRATYLADLENLRVQEEQLLLDFSVFLEGEEKYFVETFGPEKSNLQFRLVDTITNEVYVDILGDISYHMTDFYAINDYTVYLGLQQPLTVKDDIYYAEKGYNFLKENSDTFPIYFALNAIIAVVFLLLVSSQKKNTADITLSLIDKIPTDLWFVIATLFISTPFIFNFNLPWNERLKYLGMLFSPTLEYYFLIFAIFQGFLAISAYFIINTEETIAVRVKTKTFWKNTTLGIVCRLIGKSSRKLPIIWRTLFIGLVLCAINGILGMFSMANFFTWLIFALFNLSMLIFFCTLAYQMKLLQSAAESMVSGKFHKEIDTKNMFFDCKKYGQTLNEIRNGISLAVDEKLRSERMKTELITNVSHDIKTPLTSIVTCVELLENDPSEEEKREHLDLLRRQSMRMKKLVEDLVEASKATTGNLSVNLVETNLIEVVQQALGEYDEKFSDKNLMVVSDFSVECTVFADGKHLWRVLDNLFSNVYKYAQSGTRIYISITKNEELAEISIKNISSEPLNMSSEELLERFVRGDASRTTEGSGLGLNIAQNLMQLQKGTLKLTVDGDLLKVQLLFNIEL